MNVRILHSADIHYCREHRIEALQSLEVIRNTAREREVDLVAIAGDLFERGTQASDRDAMGELLAAVRDILDVAPIVVVQGTYRHDVPGCYDVLTSLRAECSLTVLQPGTAYGYYSDLCPHIVTELGALPVQPAMLVLGCPEPGKAWLLRDKEGLGSADATEAVNAAMRGILLGLGGMRREHPDLPCLMVYHGAVRGATMGAGQTVSGTDLAIGAEDLGMVMANYYALGHIHTAQKVGGWSEMRYAGSAYPTDWGELDQKSFNLVEFMPPGEDLHVETIPFPHPPRRKLVWTCGETWNSHDADGYQAKVIIRGSKEELAAIGGDHDPGFWISGALPGSIVVTEEIPVETVRAPEITEAEHLRDKVVVWAEASGLEAPRQSVLDKADTLEAEAHAAGTVGEGLHIRVRSLTLRGATGIKRGLDRDEVALDLDAYEPGLLALCGPNGVGKSTLIENLHPYTQMLTRDGALPKHFCLKDSRRELRFTDERTGAEYRALILIDPTLATPKTECYLYRDGEPLCTGRVKEYEELVDSLFGSLGIFVKSAFVAQKPPKGHPDIADATPAERKALFRELGGLDYLQTYAEAAKARADAIDTALGVERGKRGVLLPLIEQESERQEELLIAEQAHTAALAQAETVKAKGVAQKAAVEALAERVATQRDIAQKLAGLTMETARLDVEGKALAVLIGQATAAVSGRAAAAEIVHKHEDFTKAKGALQDEASKVLVERDRLNTEHADALTAHRAARDAVQAEIRRLEKYAAELERKKAGLVATVDTLGLQAEQPINETCPTCKQRLPDEMRAELQEERNRKLAALEAQQETILGLDNLLMTNGRERSTQERKLSEMIVPKAPELPAFGQQPALDAVLAVLAKLDVPAARETIRLADAAAEQIKSARAREAQITLRVADIYAERTVLKEQSDPLVDSEYAVARVALEALREDFTRASTAAARAEAEVRAVRAILEDLAQKRETLADIEHGIAVAEGTLADWRYLERACGRDGIQALELDAMGPGIAEATNALLDAAYGTRFRVEVRTTRLAGRGSKIKQVEDFEIIIHDSEAGTEQALDTLSGGELVWIRKALYDAFGIIRAKSTGTRFLTVCLDEADGALDPEARRRYVAMLQAAHVAAGRRHTIVITHSEDAQEAIGQRIVMSELAREEVRA